MYRRSLSVRHVKQEKSALTKVVICINSMGCLSLPTDEFARSLGAPPQWTDMRPVHPVILLLCGVQRQQQAGLSAGTTAVDVRRAEPVGRGCYIARGVVREGRTVA